jgi:hypothetical protein
MSETLEETGMLDTKVTQDWFIHKFQVSQQYGGPEEGGWWYDSGNPVKERCAILIDVTEDLAYAVCRAFNENEHERQKREEDYEYTSVLSYRSQHFSYDVSTSPIAEAYPKERPHYE